MTISDFATLIIALATAGSLLYVSRQVNVTRKQTKGQFLLALDEQFEKSSEITVRLINEPNFKPAGAEWGQVARLVSVFERINIMVEDGILDAALVDRLYGYRLLMLLANDAIYQRVQDNGSEWQDVIDLCYAVARHRIKGKIVVERDKAFFERVQKLDKNVHRPSQPSVTS